MSDADAERKAKAARAKKLLAQRQKKKNATETSNVSATASTSPAPGSPASAFEVPSGRTSLDENVKPDGERESSKLAKDVSENGDKALGQNEQSKDGDHVDDSDAGVGNKQNGETEVFDPPKETAITDDSEPPLPVQSTPSSPRVTNATPTDSLANLQQTVTLLIAERTDLQQQVASLQQSLVAAKSDSQLLEEGRGLISRLEQDKRDLEKKMEVLGKETEQLRSIEKELSDAQKRVADVQLERDGLKKQLDSASKVREVLEKQTEEKLAEVEKSLDRARERESGLEAELGRLRQSNTELQNTVTTATSELEDLRSSSSTDNTALTDLRKSHGELEKSHGTLQTAHDELKQTLSTLQTEHDELKVRHETSFTNHTSLETALSEAKRELETAQTKLEGSTKRADAAEKKRAALQEDNAELVKQLDEIRGRVVEVMEEKMTLAAAVESWETKAKVWDRERSELKSTSKDTQALQDQLTSLADRHRELSDMVTEHDLLKKEHAELTARYEAVKTDLETAQHSLVGVDKPVSNTASKDTDSQDDNALSNLKASHALETSQQAERIRSLESSLHATTSRVHDLSRQLTDIHAAYAAAQKERDETLAVNSVVSPRAAAAKSLFKSDDDQRSSIGRGNPSRPFGVDALLPASVRHKRQVSLSALKARMEPSYSRPLLSPMGSVQEGEESGRRRSLESSGAGTPGNVALGLKAGSQRKQFGDEIMFCCPACEGDLINL